MPGSVLEFTEYHSPDGLVYRFDASMDRFLLSDTGYGMPSISYKTRQGPLQHGNTIYDYRLQPRVIQLLERVDACNRSDYWDRRAEMLNILRPNRQLSNSFEMGVLRKYLANGDTRDIRVLVEEGPLFAARNLDVWDEWAFTEAIRFIAPDPIFYDPDLKSQTFTIAFADHLIFPFTFDGTDIVFSSGFVDSDKTITYPGTWMTFPTILITGPMDGVTITNESTDEFIKLQYGISAGETVTIHLEYGSKTVTYYYGKRYYGGKIALTSGGRNIIGSISSDSNLATFHIAPAPEVTGGVNVINVKGGSADANTAVVVSFYERYIGL